MGGMKLSPRHSPPLVSPPSSPSPQGTQRGAARLRSPMPSPRAAGVPASQTLVVCVRDYPHTFDCSGGVGGGGFPPPMYPHPRNVPPLLPQFHRMSSFIGRCRLFFALPHASQFERIPPFAPTPPRPLSPPHGERGSAPKYNTIHTLLARPAGRCRGVLAPRSRSRRRAARDPPDMPRAPAIHSMITCAITRTWYAVHKTLGVKCGERLKRTLRKAKYGAVSAR